MISPNLTRWQRSLRYELLSRRTTSVTMLHFVAVLFALVPIMTADPRFRVLTAWHFATLFTEGPATTGAILVSVLCAVAAGSEFRFGTARQTVNWMGSRHLFAITKIVANSLSAIAVALLALAINWTLLVTVFGFSGRHFSVVGTDVARLSSLVVLFIWLWGLVGSGLALLVRSQVLSVGIILGLFGMGEPLMTGWLGPDRSRWLPLEASRSALIWTHPDDPFTAAFGIAPAQSIIYAIAPLALLAAFVLILAWVVLIRRDF